MDIILQWIDLIWAPIMFFMIDKKHRYYAVGFVFACLLMLRMQYELINEWGFGEEGFPDMLLDSHPYTRGIITYSVIFCLYIVLSYYSKKTQPVIYMAASISIFFFALLTSFIIMSL